MSKRKLRKLNIDDVVYIWTRGHTHVENYEHQPCLEILTIYQEGRKQCPLSLFFKEDDSVNCKKSPDDSFWATGYPEDGVIWQTGDKNGYVNLNRPGVVALIIKYGREKGWNPETMNCPFEVLNGFEWLEAIEFPELKGN